MAEPSGRTLICKKAEERYDRHYRFKAVFFWILAALVIIIGAALAAAILTFNNSAWSTNLLAAVSAVAGSAGMALLLKVRGLMSDEEKAAYEDMKEACGDQAARDFKARLDG